MSKNAIIALIVLIIVIGAVLLFTGTKPTRAPAEPQPSSQGTVGPSTPSSQPTAGLTEDQAAQPEQGSDMATVRYSAQGFEPAQTTIKQGATVRFVNEGGPEMWVASAIHPTHTLYSGTSLAEHCQQGADNDAFDQCDLGNLYEFRFDGPGTWRYHNHLQPSDVGTVIVTE